MIILLAFAFLAGIATVLSPCIIPILPAVLSGGISGGKSRPLGIVVGLVLSFSFFTLALSALVRATGINPVILRYGAITVVFGLGLTMIVGRLGDLFSSLTAGIANLGSRLQMSSGKRNDFVGGLILGVALGLLWTPCAGPILASVTTLALTGNVNLASVFLTLFYSLGAGLPLLLIASGGNLALVSSRWLASRAERIRKAFGVIMIATAVAMLFNIDRYFQLIAIRFLPSFLPDTTAVVERELNKLRSQSEAGVLTGKPVDKISMPVTLGMLLPDLGPAPELTKITNWINSEPLTLQGLRGKVVLVDFWTYSCINCIRTFPYLKQWYETYKDQGFTIIGVHAPEFEFEKDLGNVVAAAKRFGLTYPIALDNNFGTWTAFENHYWPAHYLIDQEGRIRQKHFGEGAYVETENDIRSLLSMGPKIVAEPFQPTLPQTPETYLGSLRAQAYTPTLRPSLKANIRTVYTFTSPLSQDGVGLAGSWLATEEYITPGDVGGTMVLNFTAGKVHLVMGGNSSTPVEVKLDGQSLNRNQQSSDYTNGRLLITADREYTLVDLHGYGTHVLELKVPRGIRLYAFTFGQ